MKRILPYVLLGSLVLAGVLGYARDAKQSGLFTEWNSSQMAQPVDAEAFFADLQAQPFLESTVGKRGFILIDEGKAIGFVDLDAYLEWMQSP